MGTVFEDGSNLSYIDTFHENQIPTSKCFTLHSQTTKGLTGDILDVGWIKFYPQISSTFPLEQGFPAMA